MMNFRNGEEIEVSELFKVTWYPRTFVGMNPSVTASDRYVVVNKDGCAESWEYCRKKRGRFTLDERVYVKNSIDSTWTKAYFSHYDKEDMPHCFDYGRTSWTSSNDTIAWEHIKAGTE